MKAFLPEWTTNKRKHFNVYLCVSFRGNVWLPNVYAIMYKSSSNPMVKYKFLLSPRVKYKFVFCPRVKYKFVFCPRVKYKFVFCPRVKYKFPKSELVLYP
jgi:hypothetical protein